MEPTTTSIAMTLALGAASVLKPTAQQAVKDAYGSLKALIGSVLKVEMATFTLPVQKHIGSQTSQGRYRVSASISSSRWSYGPGASCASEASNVSTRSSVCDACLDNAPQDRDAGYRGMSMNGTENWDRG
jgi:hypothetical protein